MVPLGSIKPAMPVALCRCSQQVAHPDQVVSGQCEAKHPADPRRSAVAGLAQPGDCFEPTEDLLDTFTLLLAYQIAEMTRGSLINDGSGFASQVRGDLVVTQLLNQFLAVVALVRAQRDAMPARDRLSRGSRGRSCGIRDRALAGGCHAAPYPPKNGKDSPIGRRRGRTRTVVEISSLRQREPNISRDRPGSL